MIYLRLFLSFLEIGAVSFGGGYAMIPLIRDVVIANGWMTEEAVLNFVAVAESTPGPIAVNMATFVGSSQAGLPGALLATLGVVLPSFVIILLIAACIRGLLRYAGVEAFLRGVRPCVIGLILAAGITMALKTLLSVGALPCKIVPDYRGLVLFALLWAVRFLWGRFVSGNGKVPEKLRKQKQPSPILMILFSALYGILVYH